MPVRVFNDIDSKVWVSLAFDKVEDGPGEEKRGRLSISFVVSERDYINFSLLPIECWPRILFHFNVWPEQLSAWDKASAKRRDNQAMDRVTLNLTSGYHYLHQCELIDKAHRAGDKWLKEYDDIVKTLMGFTRRITFPEEHQQQCRNIFPFPAPATRVRTLKDTPLVQIWATSKEWENLHLRVQAMNELPEMGTSFVNGSLLVATEGMVGIFGNDRAHRSPNEVIAPYRFYRNEGIRVLPQWIYDLCELDNMD